MPARNEQLRRRVALEAARLISEHGIRDYQLAKRKAAGISACTLRNWSLATMPCTSA